MIIDTSKISNPDVLNMLVNHFNYSMRELNSYEELTDREKRIIPKKLWDEVKLRNTDYLGTATVGTLLENLKPGPFDSWGCSEEVEEQLHKLNENCQIEMYGVYRFRLADDYPSYYVNYIIII